MLSLLIKLPVKALAGSIIFLAFLCVSCASTINYEKKYPYMVANADPVSAGMIKVEFERTVSGKLESVEVEVIFYPRLNAAVLEFRRELLKYRQFWDEDARRQFATAVGIYKQDYEAKLFIDRHRKTRSVYGKVKGQVEWETFKFSRTRVAYPMIELGYRFRSKMPFFAVFMPATREVVEVGDNEQEESHQISIYFTRAQADELVKIFDQSYLMGLLVKPVDPEPVESKEPVKKEDYQEWNG